MASEARPAGGAPEAPRGLDSRSADAQRSRSLLDRIRVAVATVGATVLGAAPHVLHHAGPLAGAALLGGATGSALFGVLSFVLALPLLWRLRRRTGSWRWPGAALALMTAGFLVSTLLIGPALTRERPATPEPQGSPRETERQNPSTPSHESHHE